MYDYNPVAVQKLVDELRKQDGNQCFGQLVDTSGDNVCYCAEGVMTKVYAEHHGLEFICDGETIKTSNPYLKEYDIHAGVIRGEVDDWYSSNLLRIEHEEKDVVLVSANDIYKMTLGEIADKLEAKYLTVKE